MANISYAEGVIIFTAPNQAALDAVIEVFNTASHFTYDTVFDADEMQVSTNDNGDTVGTVPFYGSGRWSYTTNTERMIPWLSENLDAIDAKTLETLTNSWFKVTIVWCEYELGQAFVASGCAYYHKHEGEDFDQTRTVLGDESSDDLSVTSLEDHGFDSTFYTDFSRMGIENFINYFAWNDPDAIGDLADYSLDQLADAMRGHELDVFSSLEYLSEDEEGIKDYRERILNRLRS